MTDPIPTRSRSRAWPPTHPGEILREDVLPALRLTAAEAAERMGVAAADLEAVLRCEARVTDAMAERVGALCGNGPGLWRNMQAARDEWLEDQAKPRSWLKSNWISVGIALGALALIAVLINAYAAWR